MDERIIKKEDRLYCASRKGFLGDPKGSLVLSENELYFLNKEKRLFVIPVKNILSVSAERAFRFGTDRLVIKYHDVGNKEKEEKIEHRSTSSALVLGALTRLQGLYFSSWEQNISEIRFGRQKTGGDRSVEALEKLADLRDRGVLTEDEFIAKKKAILEL